MPRRIIKRYLPLHLNRRSVSGAFAVGLFFAFWPVPLQMLLAAIGAILVRVNLPISVTLVWITNPITIPPIFYFSYLVGTWMLGTPLICGTVSAVTGYVTIQIIWRRLVQRSWDRRCRRRRAARRKDAADAFQAEVEKE